MAGSVLNWTFGFQMKFSAKLKESASKSATSPSCKTLGRNPFLKSSYAATTLRSRSFSVLRPNVVVAWPHERSELMNTNDNIKPFINFNDCGLRPTGRLLMSFYCFFGIRECIAFEEIWPLKKNSRYLK